MIVIHERNAGSEMGRMISLVLLTFLFLIFLDVLMRAYAISTIGLLTDPFSQWNWLAVTT